MTFYPGWYRGRAVHIHFKIRTSLDGGSREFTSQLFFAEQFTDRVYEAAPYNARGQRTVRNSGDGIFQRDGEQLLLSVEDSSDGYVAVFDIGVDLS